MKISYLLKYVGCVSLLIGATALTNASSSFVTFSVDMSVQIGLNTFVPGTDHVSARGTFNGWGELVLAQQGSSTVYTNTANDTTNPNGGVESYKFYNSHNGQWDDGDLNGAGKNRAARLPSVSGGSLVLPTVFFGDTGLQSSNLITFRVNMAQSINLGAFVPGTSTVYARGTMNGWGLSWPLTNDPTILTTNGLGLVTSNVYVGTYEVDTGTNSSPQFKYAYEPGGSWETPSANNQVGGGDGNRFFVDTASQVLPLVDYGDQPYAPIATNSVTFQVDMTAQIFAGNFHPGTDPIEVRGSFNGWTAGANPLTNNPAAANPDIYSAVIGITNSLNAAETYKFTFGTGPTYESSSPKFTTLDSGPNDYNRIFYLPNGPTLVLPAVNFSDVALNDLLQADTPVTFSVDMNGAVGTDLHVFNPSADDVYINGLFANYNGQIGTWYPWIGGVNPSPAPAGFQMIQSATPGIYTNTVIIPKGTPVHFDYKYGMDIGRANGGPVDDEAISGSNHYRVLRSTAAGSYVTPTDAFGNQYHEPYFYALSKAGGNLTVGAPSGGVVPVAWLGRPGAHLQVNTSLTGGAWLDLPATDGKIWTVGTSSTNGFVSRTNWPASDKAFFRLVNP